MPNRSKASRSNQFAPGQTSTTESTSAEIAEEPAHRLMTKPNETTSPRAPCAISRTVGSISSATMFLEKKVFDVLINWRWIVGRVSGPKSGAT